MAESAGQVVLTLSADTRSLEAGLKRSQQDAQRAADAIKAVFNTQGASVALNSIQALQGRLANLRQAFTSAEIGSQEFRRLQIEIRRTQQELDKASGAAKNAGAAFSAGIGGIGSRLAGLAGLVGIGALAKQIGDTGIESSRATIQLEALAGAYGEASQAAEAVSQVQQILGISVNDATRGFSRLYGALRGAGFSLDQIQVLFVGINNAARLSGVGTQEATNALIQLKQGLASGRLAGDELRSVLEQMPVFAQAVAKEMGVGIGQLRQLGSEGAITADVVYRAARSLAGATVPARAQIDQLIISYQNLQTEAAKAFGPAVSQALVSITAGLIAFRDYLKANKQGLADFGSNVLGLIKTLAPLAIGIMAVQAAFKAWALAVQAVRIAQAGLLALQGPKGWAILGAALLATAYAAKQIQNGFDGTSKAIAKSRKEAEKSLAKFKELLNQDTLTPTPLPEQPLSPADAALKRNLLSLELAGTEEQIIYAKQLATLQGTELVKLQNKLAINEKIRQQRAVELELMRELAKPPGAGNQAKVDELVAKQERVNAEVRKAYADAGTALYTNATRAADALKSAEASLQSTLRGGFEYLTPQLQQEQIQRAQAAIQPLVNQGVIRQGIDISTPEKLFQVAGFAESYSSAATELAKATTENTKAISALAGKNWAVNVSVDSQGGVRSFGDLLPGALQ